MKAPLLASHDREGTIIIRQDHAAKRITRQLSKLCFGQLFEIFESIRCRAYFIGILSFPADNVSDVLIEKGKGAGKKLMHLRSQVT